jgi:hypothetical protein
MFISFLLGDSAGMNLAFAITRYLIDANHPEIPVP